MHEHFSINMREYLYKIYFYRLLRPTFNFTCIVKVNYKMKITLPNAILSCYFLSTFMIFYYAAKLEYCS